MVSTQTALVRELLKAQLPTWANLPVVPVNSTGTDNSVFRAGEALAVRLPKVEWASAQPAREHQWLSHLAAKLPLEIPKSLALGAPGLGYRWQWSVHNWITGSSAAPSELDNADAAERLAGFVAAMRLINISGGPASGQENGHRGAPLIERDISVRRALAQLHDEPGIDAVRTAWDDALNAPTWSGEPAWLHGDLQASNLIVRDGLLVAVIDFGLMAVGDPACDLMAAWTCFTPASRRVFLSAVGANEADVRRGRGWAASTALIALAYYREKNPVMAQMAQSTLVEVSCDFNFS
jgi:aminoglycoside phosphotransferase (APT) family kinase protein